MNISIGKKLLLLSLLYIVTVPLLSQEHSAAERPTGSELDVYLRWLHDHPQDPAFALVFQKAIQSITRLEDAEKLHAEFFLTLEKPEKLHLLTVLVDLAEQLSDYTAAWKYYRALLEFDEKPEYRIKLATQSILLGEYNRALRELDERYFDQSTRSSRIVYQLYCYTFLGQLDTALALVDSIVLSELEGFELITLWDFAQHLELTRLLEGIENELNAQENNALLTFVNKRKRFEQVSIVPNPLLLLSLSTFSKPRDSGTVVANKREEPTSASKSDRKIPFGMQIGSFRDRSNAISYVTALLAVYSDLHIYEATVHTDTVYRVYAENSKRLSTEEFIIAMKSRRIEGVIEMMQPSRANLVDQAQWAVPQEN